jgi:hypothetical protein
MRDIKSLKVPEETPESTFSLVQKFRSEFFREALKIPEYYAMRRYDCACAMEWGIPVPPELLAYLRNQHNIDEYAKTSISPHPVSLITKQSILANAKKIWASERAMDILDARISVVPYPKYPPTRR